MTKPGLLNEIYEVTEEFDSIKGMLWDIECKIRKLDDEVHKQYFSAAMHAPLTKKQVAAQSLSRSLQRCEFVSSDFSTVIATDSKNIAHQLTKLVMCDEVENDA